MIRSAGTVVAYAVLVACFFFHPAFALGGQDEPARLRAAADALESEAAQAGTTKGGIRNPAVLPIAGSSNAADTDLQRWFNEQLASIARVRSNVARKRELRELSDTLRRLAASSGPAQAPAESPELVAQRVLSARQYQYSDAGQPAAPHESIWERIATFFGDLIGRIFSGIFKVGAAAPIVGQIVAIALVALLVVALAYLGYRIFETLARRRKSARIEEGTSLSEPIDPDIFYRKGVQAASQGRYAQAVALLFQASLAWFDREGTLAFDPSLTPIEYRRAVKRALGRANPDFDKLAHAFVLAAFAERPMTHGDWSEVDAAYAQMCATVAA